MIDFNTCFSSVVCECVPGTLCSNSHKWWCVNVYRVLYAQTVTNKWWCEKTALVFGVRLSRAVSSPAGEGRALYSHTDSHELRLN